MHKPCIAISFDGEIIVFGIIVFFLISIHDVRHLNFWEAAMFVVIAFIGVLISTNVVFAQCDSLGQVHAVDDTLYAMTSDTTVDRSQFVLANEIAPYFYFDLQKDSARLTFAIGEVVHNSHWVYLDHWCKGKSYNYDEAGDSARWDYTNAQLSAISVTKPFTIHAGDTIGFFREYFWKDHISNQFSPSHYVSSDRVILTVELIDAGSGQRIALLDSTWIDSTTSNRKPCIKAWKPVMARIGYVVPASQQNVNVRLRANVATSGFENATFMRYDITRFQQSKRHLEDAGWKTYTQAVVDNTSCQESCVFTASGLSNPRRIHVDIDNGQQQVDCIKIVDLGGNVVNTTMLPAAAPYAIAVQNAGVYIVVGYSGNSPVCTRLTSVQ